VAFSRAFTKNSKSVPAFVNFVFFGERTTSIEREFVWEQKQFNTNQWIQVMTMLSQIATNHLQKDPN
jgi:hypothetical protein